uniref:Proteasome subunit beta n=1 Tax=Chromera velia CCMP2878 TaxID=1169474 RepID=A0A0G4I2U8_9ALVE|mmetsp:Transcript_52082/g.101990  ORF Transcript_52082/g.101990 Transcript_52082/m.101990 type:complete len:245 (-) Transcript_52082:416-1150(-)|eukprot:Cvel_10464.t1-p1 / transcript=Cvel_10464.t1 / gene=Cvel_10464 / organism=Chromera_velia_CCMP2878 / gene_product=Proteasome subunit beta type-6, putative / transcript_product=Proteasome subunit beta type-6, putative / location=Cvel_scaffold630:68356-69087(-) / protein_length=244 / sequence_SO=supercontig / SO=protein_coding / is_pseudo=false
MSLEGTFAHPKACAETDAIYRSLGLSQDALACLEEQKPGSEAVSTGTTIMAVSYDGGVVMGADTRTSAGAFIVNRASRKISRVHDRIFVCRSGSAADTQALTNYVRHFTTQHAMELGEAPRVATVANLYKLLCYNNKNNLMAGLIVAGWDAVKGGQVYQIPLGGTLLPGKYAAGGSGSTYIWGLLDSDFREGMSKDECKAFVTKMVSHALTRDGSSGGMVRLITISEDDVVEEVVTGDKLPYGP